MLVRIRNERVVVVLHELGVCFDEEGRPHSSKTNALITMENLQLDPVALVTAITRYVGFGCIYEEQVQMKMKTDYSFEEIKIPLRADCRDCVQSSIFATKGGRSFCFVTYRLLGFGDVGVGDSLRRDVSRDLESQRVCGRWVAEGLDASVLSSRDGGEHGNHRAEPQREQLQLRRLQWPVDVGSASLQRDSREPPPVRVGPHHFADICAKPRDSGLRSRRLPREVVSPAARAGAASEAARDGSRGVDTPTEQRAEFRSERNREQDDASVSGEAHDQLDAVDGGGRSACVCAFR